MKANLVRRRHKPRLLPISVACCLGVCCSQPVSEVRFEPAPHYRAAYVLAHPERAPLLAR
ncbi:hypothetical protein [Paraburkholderia phosphatilytica]|uniref:hypothetical protein n=1 Tax=Paraburkholderia phosphatilytica TaxID=2282883 RepID=UPI000E51DB8D|nr:hypothetical protein [Paraburkholderia phosphatilytica]